MAKGVARMPEEELRNAVLAWRKETNPVGMLPTFLKRSYPRITAEDIKRGLLINVQISEQLYNKKGR